MKTLTVAQLIELLQGQSSDAKVIFSIDYGDYCHTPQALPLTGEIETVSIRKSGYSTSGFAIDDREDSDSKDIDTYLVIR